MESRYRDLYENAPIIYFSIETDGHILDANTAAISFLGYSLDELRRIKVFDLYAEECRPKAKQVFESFKEGIPVENEEMVYARKDGSRAHGLLSVSPLQDRDGNIVASRSVVIDITDRMKVEEALRESEERFRELAESITDVFFAMDVDLRYTYWNRASEALTGIPAADAIGRSIYELFPDEQGARAAEIYKEVIRTGEVRAFIKEHSLGGSKYYFEISAYPTRNGLSVFTRDITERKRTEDELRASEERYHAFLESVTDSVYVLDREWRHVVVNDAASVFTGIPRERLLGGKLTELFPGVEATPFFQAFRQVMETREKTVVEDEYVFEDGRRGWYEVLVYPVPEGILCISRDITRRKMAERSLKKSEEKYRLIVDSAHEGIWAIDRDAVTTFVNSRMSEMLDYEEEEMLGRSLFDFMDEQGKEIAEINLERGKAGVSEQHDFEFIRKDGSRIYASLETSPLYDAEGEYVGALAMVADISERMALLRELEERELFLRRINDNMLDLISQADADGNLVYLSPSSERILGYKVGELLGTNVMDLVHPDDLAAVLEGYARSSLELVPSKAEFRARRADGSYIWMESVGNPLVGEGGEVIGAIFVTRDITDRKRAEERLQRLNRCFLELGNDHLENLIMIVETGKELVQAAELHYSRMSSGIFQLYHTGRGAGSFERVEDAECLVCYEAIVTDRREPIIVEDLAASGYEGFLPEAKDKGLGSYLAYPVRLHDTNVGVLGLFYRRKYPFGSEERDLLGILARAIAVEEERLAHEEELRDFIDIASHELRHPMTIIKGYAATLSLYQDRMDAKTREKVLEDIDTGVNRLERLVYQLLDTARIERRKLVPERTETGMRELLEGAVSEMRGRQPSSSIAVLFDGVPARIDADAEKVKQVLVVLLENAVNYSPPGSPVEIEAVPLEGGGVTVAVKDRGWGVPEKDREKIFQRFYQIGNPAHHSTEGIGLGLHIAREIIEAHGGRIWCESREGGGSIFRFTLPEQALT